MAEKTATKEETKKTTPNVAKAKLGKKMPSIDRSAFAVIETGGKQYKVHKGEIITIEKLDGDLKEGDKVTFDQVLLTDDGKTTKVGEPTISGAKVEGKFVETGRGKKTTVIHYISKSRHFTKKGHRQPYSQVEITKVA